jgi:ligand-binding sensor domain-containing protein
MARHRRILLTLLCLLVFLPGAGAVPLWESNLSFRRFTTIDGLPQMQIETVWQDAQGYIYIGTLSGFVRYDGVSLKPFLGGRRENIVQFSQVDGEVRAMGFVRQWSIKGDRLNQSQIDPSGQRLLNNLNAADLPPDYVLMEDRQERGRVLCRLTAGGMEPVLESPLLDEMTPDRKLYVDSSGIYIPTPLGLFLAAGGKTVKCSAKTGVFSLIRTGDGLLALSDDGIYRATPDSFTIITEHHFDSPDLGLSVRQNSKGDLFIADAHTIWRYDGASLLQLASGFNLIRGIFIDRWDRLWAATYQGLYCFYHCNFTSIRLTDKNDIVRASAVCDGHPVMGTLEGKVLVDGELVEEDADNYFEPWGATLGGKAYLAGGSDVVSVDGEKIQWLGLPKDRYRFVAGAGDSLIIGASRSVLSWDPENGCLDTLTTEIVRPWCAAAGKDGRLWVSGNPGLYCLTGSPGSISVNKVVSTPTTPVVTAMASGRDGLVCYALGDQVFSIDGEEIRLMAELEPSLHGHEIRSVHISPRGFLVVAAIDGLLVANLDTEGRASDFLWFDSRSGFTTIEPLMGSMAEAEDGTVWLAGLEDMISFRPGDLLADNRLPTVIPAPRPWWRQWWAVFLFAAVFSLCIWILARRSARRQAGRKMASLEREKRQKDLQLQAVRLKSIPHFHSNVLSGIEYYVLNKSADEASHYLKLYSDFTNRTLSDIDLPSRPVSAEVEYIKGYLELEKLRYADRLRYSITVDPLVDPGTKLPTMLLHTYCQNAVKHGIASKSGAGTIEITVALQRRSGVDGVLVKVTDDGIGRANAARIGGYSTGQGLKILQQQIDLYNQGNVHKIEQQVKDLTDADGHPAGTSFETWVPLDYIY